MIALGQTNPGRFAQPDIHLTKTSEKIVLDGVLDEAAWQSGRPAEHFWQQFPIDTNRGEHQTKIYMTYDDQNLYVATVCYTTAGEDYVIPSLKRDYNFSGNDNISILFDTYSDGNNAFLFGMNPYGVRREALISNGGRARGDFADSWDNRWRGQSKIYDDHWIAEFEIPFKTIRFKEGSQRWRFNSYRYDTQTNEITTWTQIPQNQIIMDLGFMGNMIWDQPLKKPGTNISVIPYTRAGTFRDFEDPSEKGHRFDGGLGGDAKIGLSAGLNLDLTINPDFSQVEVDDQVTNLDRFEIRLPEKRQFFLENADLFSSFGGRRTNPFFTRRIGVAIDTSTGQNVQNKIHYGARLSGKLNENLRVGLINMQAAKQEENGLPAFNYTVAALQHRVFSRSNISAIFVNKQSTNAADSNGGDYNQYNRVLGLEYRLATPDSRWTGKAFYHQVFSPRVVDHKYSHSVQLEYKVPRYRLELAQLFVGQGFDAEVGFIPRRDYHLFSPEIQLYFYPKSKLINNHNVTVDYRQIYKVGRDGNTLLDSYDLSDRQLEMMWDFDFTDRSQGAIAVTYNYIYLLNDFDPTRSQADGIFLPAGTDHTFTEFSFGYRSDSRKLFSYQLKPTLGQFYSGWRYGLEGELMFRYQPFGFVSLNYAVNHLRLDDPFQPATIWLVGPRIDLTFSRKVFWTTFIQYNSQFDNLNINTRFQWRFQPVSDFFLVYTDNYLFDPFSDFTARNRALVAKFTYWLNL